MGASGNSPRLSIRRLVVAATLLGCASGVVVYGGKQAVVLDGLAPEYAQHVFGTTDDAPANYLGGIVVMQNGDVIASECAAQKGAKLHKFLANQTYTDHGTTLHQEIEMNSGSGGGCGITLHPNGFIYSNMKDGSFGVAKIDPSNGAVVDKLGTPGNAVGIAVDPVSLRIVYTDQGCKPGFVSPRPAACQIIELDPVARTTRVFASFATPTSSSVPYLNGIAFDPTGTYLLVTRRVPTKALLVLSRAGVVVNPVTLPAEPIGLGFHAAPDQFVVTSNVNGTMTRLDFPGGDYLATPTKTEFARGAGRTDLAQAGPDGCLYVSKDGTVYDDGEEEEYDDDGKKPSSIIQICEGFVPPPGVIPNPPPLPSSMCGYVYNDVNNDGVLDPAEPGIASVSLSLAGVDNLGRDVARTTTSDATGKYCFNSLRMGTYTVTEVQPSGYLDGKDSDGSTPVGIVGMDAFASVPLAAGVADNNNNFGELLASSIGGFVYLDENADGARGADEDGIEDVDITLAGTDDRGAAVTMQASTGTDGGYSFGGLRPGSYTLSEAQPAVYVDGAETQGTPGTGSVAADSFVNVVLDQGVSGANNNFGEIFSAPSVTLVVTSNGAEHNKAPGQFVAAGSTVAVTYSVTNTGNLPLTGVVVTDSQGTAIGCGTAPLQPGAVVNCTGNVAALAGENELIAVVIGTDPVGSTATISDSEYYFGATPAISIVTETNDSDNESGTGPTVSVGSKVTWTYRVENTGNVDLSNIVVIDDRGGAIDCPEKLDAGKSFKCTATGTAAIGQYTNVGTVTASDPTGAVVTAQNGDRYFGGTSGISLVVKTNDSDNDSGTGPFVVPGSVVTWTYVVENTGNVTLSNISLSDDRAGAIACPDTTLAAAASFTCVTTGTAVSGQYVNDATVKADDAMGKDVKAKSGDRYFGSSPAVSIVTKTNGVTSASAPGPSIAVGGSVTWTYDVKNTGNVLLTNVTITDGGAVCPATTLAPGATLTCTKTGTGAAGQQMDTGAVTAHDPLNRTVSAQSVAYYFGASPAISIVTKANGTAGGSTPGPSVAVGGSVTWTYDVVNTGNVTLSNVAITDGGPVCPAATLAPGATLSCTKTGTAVAGQQTSTGAVTATDPLNRTVSAQSVAYYYGAAPAISFTTKTNGTDNDSGTGPVLAVGDAVTWTYAVVNTGNVTLTNVAITDGGAVCAPATLAPGATLTCTKTGTAVAGQYTNTGAVTASSPFGSLSAQNVDHYFGSSPALTFVAKTNGTDSNTAPGPSVAVGSPVTWTYIVSNTGNVALTSVTVTDGGVVCTQATLAAGTSLTCTKTGTAAAGQYTTAATVAATAPLNKPLSAQAVDYYFGVKAAVSIVTKTNGTDNETGTGPSITAGSAVTWTYYVVNTGNVALANVTVTDDKAGVATCPANTLAAGANMTCTKAGTSVAGQYTNVGTVTATGPLGNVSASNGDRYLGTAVADKTAPGCVVQTFKGPPFSGTMTFTDTGSGLASLTVTTNINFKVTMPAFTQGTKSPVTVTATRIDEKKSAQLLIKAVDVAGNAITCDPVVTTVTKLKQDTGNQTWPNIPYAEHYITVENGDPGLRRMEIEVNGKVFVVRKLEANEKEVLDVRSAMKPGNNNTIVLIPKGKKGESALVIIADVPFGP